MSTSTQIQVSSVQQSAATPNSYDFAPSTSSTFGQIGSMLSSTDKGKKRTLSRSQKLIGDLYLLAGRLDMAINTYITAMEGLKQNYDYHWQASTLESYNCALLLTFIKKAGSGVCSMMFCNDC